MRDVGIIVGDNVRSIVGFLLVLRVQERATFARQVDIVAFAACFCDLGMVNMGGMVCRILRVTDF